MYAIRSYYAHLVELRKRLALSVASVFVMFMIAFTFHEYILEWITKPLNDALTQVGLVIESKHASHWKIQHVITSYSIHYTKLYEKQYLHSLWEVSTWMMPYFAAPTAIWLLVTFRPDDLRALARQAGARPDRAAAPSPPGSLRMGP